MVNMYEVVEYLCGKNNVSIAQMCRETGIRQSVFTELKYGRTRNLSLKNMVKVANYFGVSTDVFNEGVLEEAQPNQADAESVAGYHYQKEKKPAATQDDELNEYLEELKNREELRMLFSLTKGATKEEVERAVRILEAALGK